MDTRRNLLRACSAFAVTASLAQSSRAAETKDKAEEDVGAVEDLMREHGVLRRALLIYSETAAKIRSGAVGLDVSALHRTAKLFRTFGEDYHERKLEEAYIFPRIKKAGGPAASYPDVLQAQHDRGRQITDTILKATAKGRIDQGERFATMLAEFARMYQHHAAREDTIVFPAWKSLLGESELRELGETFEDIEHRQFGEDGFETAVKEIGDIEQALGLSDLSQFTAPPPP